METLIALLLPYKVRVRVKCAKSSEPSGWDWPLFSPVSGYVETGTLGPVRVEDVEWIEVESQESTRIGRLVPDEITDHSDALAGALRQAQVAYSLNNGIFRISAS